MLVRGLSPINAEPILPLVRAHARRTAIGRLAVVYEIVPSCHRRVVDVNVGTAADNNWHGVINQFGAKPQPQALISLGEALYMDSIIEGGVNGEMLPMDIDLGVKLNMIAHAPGALVDMVG